MTHRKKKSIQIAGNGTLKAIDNAKSENVSGANLNELSDIVPASITVKATSEEQVKSIVNMENNNDVQVVFAGRGEEAKKLLNR